MLTKEYVREKLSNTEGFENLSDERAQNIIDSSYLLAELVIEDWIKKHKKKEI